MTVLSAPWVHMPATQAAASLLSEGGHQVWFVGGCVRNTLMEMPVTDIDMCTDAPPDRVMELAKASGIKVIPTGLDHGTVTLVIDNQPFEVTTLRRDVETDGRRAVVAFSDNLEEDARRRDFTINALYALPDGTVVDPLGGLPDLHERRVRFIEVPEDRIKEDALRILRFFRFTATHADPDLGIDAEGLAACAVLADTIDGLSKERIGQEMRKLLAAKNPSLALSAMEKTGSLMRVIPGATAALVAPLVHVEDMLGLAPDHLRRLAVMGGEHAQKNLRLAKSETRQLALYLTDQSDPARNGYKYGETTALGILALHAASFGENPSEEAIAAIRHAARQRFPLTGEDFSSRLKGKAIGDALALAEDRWIASGFTLTRDDLLA